MALIAGRGDLPVRVAARCRAEGRPLHVLIIKGHGDPDAYADLDVPVVSYRLGQGGAALAYARKHGISDLILAGGVRRPSLSSLWPDAYAARFVARVGMRALGDDGLLRAVMAQMEAEGLKVHPAHTILDDGLGAAGPRGRHRPDAAAWVDIRRGRAVAHALGAVDVGQSVVVQQGVVLGVEALEGTDALLARCGSLRLPGTGGVLVKVCKPGQDRRADLPTLGVASVEVAHAAGLRGIAYEAGAALLLDQAAMVERADALGLFLIGLEAEAAKATERGGDDGDDPLIYLIAGEPSGDALAARLMAAVRARLGDRVRFAGIGGEAMAEQGLESRIDQRELAIMGFLEVLPRALALKRRIAETVAHIERTRPAVVVTVDSWGFTGRVAKALKARGSTVPRVHYVAPMVWAWKESRKHAVAERVDHLMTLWPFECAYFSPLGLACTHVGHAVIESGADRGDGAAFRQRHGIAADVPILVVLPGSRRTEVGRLLPIFRAAVERLAADRPGLRVVVPTVATVADTVEAALVDWPVPALAVRGAAEKHDAFAAATAALAASGTVSLELAMADVPHVIAYRVNPVSATLFRLMTPLRYAGPVNILMDRLVVPELLQKDCRPGRLAKAMAPLLDGASSAARQREDFAKARRRLVGEAGASPSDRAAAVIAAHVQGEESP
ncbi:lipid-A-disaccharide synthase [Rhodospira trueperi]|uniref:lipid-A-disaccharide synthase n=1 Tax=Rhodospira trueperi TaxID=69960 RepID=UPI0031843915